MRIISGIAGGRKLAAPPGEKTRPTSDKLRGSLFNILGLRTQEAWVLDVFGGTGALALEAMSRGAARAVIIEKDRAAWDVIQKNAQSVLGADFSARVDIIRGDYRAVFSSDETAFGGNGNISEDYVYQARNVPGHGVGFEVYIPSRTAVVFRHV